MRVANFQVAVAFEIEPELILSLGVVDYSKLFSLRRHAGKNLIPQKVLQLKPEFVAAMAKKLAIYFYRIS